MRLQARSRPRQAAKRRTCLELFEKGSVNSLRRRQGGKLRLKLGRSLLALRACIRRTSRKRCGDCDDNQ
jgi:hypothetical protein